MSNGQRSLGNEKKVNDRKILIVDDEERLLRSLAFYFEDEGYDVYISLSGEDAMEVLRKENIAACIVDMRLPGIDGNEVIRMANSDQLLDKFIIHTGSTDYLVPADIKAMGISSSQVFLKPLTDLSVLVQAIQVLIEGNE